MELTGNKDCVIVIPEYRNYEDLSDLEKASLILLSNVIKKHYDICLICGESIQTKGYYDVFLHNCFYVTNFSDEYFKSIEQYSSLCVSESLYLAFIEYEYMLIYQTDAWIFYDNIDYFIKLGYDWYGAVWPSEKQASDSWFDSYSISLAGQKTRFYLHTGNGGFCLRRIKACLYVLSNYLSDLLYKFVYLPEDWDFCISRYNYLNMCPISVGTQFSIECYIPYNYNTYVIDKLPMGIHNYKQIFNYLKDQDLYYVDKLKNDMDNIIDQIKKDD